MNKKLLAAAVAAVVAAPSAYAEATLYGKFHTSIDAIDYETSLEDNYEVNSRASRIGVKGSEDLGNGLKAIYQLELGFNSSGDGRGQDGGNVFGSKTRNTFVGLSGGFGTFLVGRHDTPAKMAFYATGNERLGDSVIDLNLGNNLSATPSTNAPIGVFHEYRANDAIAYVSPNFSGFTVAAAIIPGEDTGIKETTGTPAGTSFSPTNPATSGTPAATGLVTSVYSAGTSGVCKNDRNGLADHYSVGLMYKGNGLKAGAGYASYDLDKCDLQGSKSYEVMQIGASYTFNNFSVGAQYEDSSNIGGIKKNDYRAWGLTGKATFGNNAVSLVYTDATLDSAIGKTGDVDRSGWGVAGEHNFSKRTKVYAAYADGENKSGDRSDPARKRDDSVFSLGMIHNF